MCFKLAIGYAFQSVDEVKTFRKREKMAIIIFGIGSGTTNIFSDFEIAVLRCS